MNQTIDNSVMTRPAVCTLNEVLTYQNESIIHKFLERFDLPFDEAKDLFEETKKWLWVNAIAMQEMEAGGPEIELFIDGPMVLVDEMWHTFILFTRPYQDFCNQYFGFYIHHAPTTKKEKTAMKAEHAANPEQYKANLEEEYERHYEYIYEKLGEATLSKWYSDFTDKYTTAFVNQVRRPYQQINTPNPLNGTGLVNCTILNTVWRLSANKRIQNKHSICITTLVVGLYFF